MPHSFTSVVKRVLKIKPQSFTEDGTELHGVFVNIVV